MKKLLVILTCYSIYAAQTIIVTNLTQLPALNPVNTNVVFYSVTPATGQPYKLQLTQSRLETLIGTTLATDSELNSAVSTLNTSLAGKQPAFSTAIGVTNIANILSAVFGAGTNTVLTTNGNQIVINSSGGTGIPGGGNLQIQVNSNSTFGATSYLCTDNTYSNFYVGGSVTVTNIAKAAQFQGIGTTANSNIQLPNDAGTFYFSLQAYDTSSGHVNIIAPPAAFGAIPIYVLSGTNMYLTNLTVGNNLYLAGTTLTGATNNGVPGGSTTQLQYNSNNIFAGALMTVNAQSNLVVSGSVTSTNGFINPQNGAVATLFLGDIDDSAGARLSAYDPMTAQLNIIFPPAPLPNNTYSKWTIAATTNMYLTNSIISEESSSVIQVGADAATAITQQIKAYDGSGTDKDGATLLLTGGQSTGTGRGGSLYIQTSPSATTGSGANAYSTRAYYSAKGVSLTESTATLYASLSLASSKFLGATLTCTVDADDGTDFQSLTSLVRIDAVNKAGTVTATLTQTDNTTAASAGTLTCTYTAVANGNNVDLKANAVSSLTQTTLKVRWAITGLNSDSIATVTAQ